MPPTPKDVPDRSAALSCAAAARTTSPRVGLISGSGAYDWPGLPAPAEVPTPYGAAQVAAGQVAGVEVVHVARHGAGHARLSNQVQHRANLYALLDAGVNRLIALTACGAVDPAVPAGSLVVFDDLYFPSNRLPDGSLCTWYTEPGEPGRGHWVFEDPFSAPIRRALLEAAADTGVPVIEGCYGHVDGPRFNSRAEIAALSAAGVTAVSQTCGPEVVLAGEAELPMALLGYVTNGVAEDGEPVDALMRRVAESRRVLAGVIDAALPRLALADPVGVVHRFDAASLAADR